MSYGHRPCFGAGHYLRARKVQKTCTTRRQADAPDAIPVSSMDNKHSVPVRSRIVLEIGATQLSASLGPLFHKVLWLRALPI